MSLEWTFSEFRNQPVRTENLRKNFYVLRESRKFTTDPKYRKVSEFHTLLTF